MDERPSVCVCVPIKCFEAKCHIASSGKDWSDFVGIEAIAEI